MSRKCVLRWLVGGNALLSVAFQLAEAFAQDESIAEGLFRAGRQALKEGDVARACANLNESERLDPSVGTLLNLAICEEQLGHIATAWSKYRQVQDISAPDDARLAIARHGMQLLEPKLPWLRILPDLVRPEGAVKLDATELPASTLGTWLPVDPGIHHIELERPGDVSITREVTVALGRRTEVDLSKLAPSQQSRNEDQTTARASVAPNTARSKTPSALDLRSENRMTTATTAIWVAAGIAASGFVSAGVLSAVAVGQKGTVDAHCGRSLCDGTGLHAAENGSRLLRAADVGLVVGITGAAAVGGFLLWRHTHLEIRAAPRVDGAALLCSAEWL